MSFLRVLKYVSEINSTLWKRELKCLQPLPLFHCLNARHTSFYNKLPADDLWRGVTAVSNAGKKRGRGKGSGKKLSKDLNRGQVIGCGKLNVLWPGLNAPVIRGREIIRQQILPEDPDREKSITKIREQMGHYRMSKLSPIDRGWSGSKMPGRSVGAPDGLGEETFKGFDTRVLENKIVFIMKGNLGRKRRYSVLSVTGNGRGIAGFAVGKASEARTALRKSKNRASQKLIKIELCNNRTVHHDFFCVFGKTKLFVSKKPEGYGLVCHRAIQTICQVAGIKDLHAKIEGSTNLQHIVKAFFIGLFQQKTHTQIAEDAQMHLVEYHKIHSEIRNIVASPSSLKKTNENDEHLSDFSRHLLGNRIVLKKKKNYPFFYGSVGHNVYLRRKERFRNQNKVRLAMGICNSH